MVPAVGAVHALREDRQGRTRCCASLLDTAREIQGEVLAHARRAARAGRATPSGALRRRPRRAAPATSARSSEILHEEIDKLEQLSREGVGLTGTPSGFRDLDDITGGFQPGNLIVLAARPSMGKCALVTNIAENAAVEHGKPVALFSLEMSETELAQRFVASQAAVPSDKLRKGRVARDRWPKVLKAMRDARQRAAVHRRLQRHRHPRAARQGAPAARQRQRASGCS